MLSFILSQDRRLMRFVNRWRAPRWFRFWMLSASRAGDGWLWCALGAVLLLTGGPRKLAAVSSGTLAGLVGLTLVLVLKRFSGRERPCAVEPHCWAALRPPDQSSFPSGHSMTAFAVMVPVALVYPEFTPGWLFCAGSVALSRIVLGMHFLSDVLAGSTIGALLGYAAYRVLL